MRTDSLLLSRQQAVFGAVAAVGVWVVGLVAATGAASVVFGSGTLSSGALFFYNAHLVPVSPVGGVTDAGGNAVVQMLGALGLLATLLPFVLLGLVGAVLARRADADSARDAAIAGVSVVPGYLLLSVVGAGVLTGPLFGGVYRPNVLLAALLAGVVVPIVAVTVGGVLGRVIESAAGRLRSTYL